MGHGVADIQSKEPVIQDTVFRVGSITKTVTAIAVMRLWEQGLVDLDTPANRYLRAPVRAGPPPPGHRLPAARVVSGRWPTARS